MIVIGVCGSSGSGKGYICKKLQKYGAFHIDTDKVYRDIATAQSPCVNELSRYFGEEILDSEGNLDRRELSKKVFEGENAEGNLKMLNSIAHKYIRIETERILEENENNGVKVSLVDAPVLFESGFDNLCDYTLCVTAPLEKKIERIVKRDGITEEKARARLASQKTDDELRRLCKFEIINDDINDMDAKALELLRTLGVI